MSQRPTVIGLLLCEQIIVEEDTHNVTLVNCFTRLKVEEFPSGPQRFALFAALTDGLGDVTLDVVIVGLDNEEEVFRQARRLQFRDPLQEIRFLFRITRCAFPVAGPYEVGLLADGESLARHRFEVTKQEGPK
jgi:hypothetical protein